MPQMSILNLGKAASDICKLCMHVHYGNVELEHWQKGLADTCKVLSLLVLKHTASSCWSPWLIWFCMFFQVHGTCLGMETLATIVSSNYTLLAETDAEDAPAELLYTNEAKTSHFIKSLPKDVVKALQNSPIAMENHGFGKCPDWKFLCPETNKRVSMHLLVSVVLIASTPQRGWCSHFFHHMHHSL